MRFNDDLHIRWMIRSDMKRVIAIENWCFPHPWTEADFIHCLRQRNCIGMVVEQCDEIVGYMIYELHKSRISILTMAVDPKHQRTGIGTAMIAKLRGKLSDRRHSLEYKVSEWNDAGIYFLRDCGFFANSVIRDYFDNGETAYGFRLSNWKEEVRTIHAKGGEIKWQR
jgi:[ribosomal protein S18]-alanine N-acetyltransferase